MGVEPTYPAWKAGILADVLCPRNSIAYYSKRTPICQRNPLRLRQKKFTDSKKSPLVMLCALEYNETDAKTGILLF